MKCQNCGHEQSEGKFCGKCGSPMPLEDSSEPRDPLDFISSEKLESESVRGYISWRSGQGEIARIVNEKELEIYGGGLRGFIIAPHQKALIYSGGKLLAELQGGTYDIPSRPSDKELNEREGGVWQGVKGAGKAFFNFFMGTPRKEKLRKAVKSRIQSDLDRFLESVKAGRPFSLVICRSGPFRMDLLLNDIKTADLSTGVGLDLTCQISNLENLHSAYLADRSVLKITELEHSLRSVVEGKLLEAFLSVEAENLSSPNSSDKIFGALTSNSAPCLKVVSLNKVSIRHEELEEIRKKREELILAEKNLVELIKANDFENRLQSEQYRSTLQNEKSKEEFASALQEINKDGLLREEDLDNFLQDIEDRAEDRQISRSHALDLRQQENLYESELKKEDLIELERKREKDESAHALDLEGKRREFDRQQEKADEESDLDTFEKFLDITDKDEAKKSNREHTQRLGELEQFKGMTEEQILLARPDLNADMIKALVDGSKDKELADKQVQMGQENVKMMKDFMVKQLDATRDITKDSESNKQKEIDRIQKTVGQTEERLSKVVESTVGVFKGGPAGQVVRDGTKGNEAELSFRLASGKEDKGLFSLSQIKTLINSGEFDSQCKAWTKGMDNWVTAVQVPEIAELLASPPSSNQPNQPANEDIPPPL